MMTALLPKAASLDLDWLASLEKSVPAYLARLRHPKQPGRYLPCERGATRVGREMALGFSCFALKTEHILGRWGTLPGVERQRWLKFIDSFQDDVPDGAFLDEPQIASLNARAWREHLARFFGRPPAAPFSRSIILAETRHAITTLAEVGLLASRAFTGFPFTPETVRAWLQAQDWTRPWSAGGPSAALVVFIKTQAPLFLPEAQVEALLDICREFYATLLDEESGAYFRGPRPGHGELIHGAMKVLMALAWLGGKPHRPERLVSTCLKELPAPHGAHLGDAIYILHQCLSPGHTREDVSQFALKVAHMIRAHAQPDGGFSFHLKRAQTHYCGVKISSGKPESDIQGTCLMLWALAMIWHLVEPQSARWRTLKP